VLIQRYKDTSAGTNIHITFTASIKNVCRWQNVPQDPIFLHSERNGIFPYHKFRTSEKMTLKRVYIQRATFPLPRIVNQNPLPFKQRVDVRGEKANS